MAALKRPASSSSSCQAPCAKGRASKAPPVAARATNEPEQPSSSSSGQPEHASRNACKALAGASRAMSVNITLISGGSFLEAESQLVPGGLAPLS